MIFLCNDLVEKRLFGFKDFFSIWVNKNVKDFLRRFFDIKKSGGFYVIILIIMVRDIWIIIWIIKGILVVIGVLVEIDNVVKIDVLIEFYVGEIVMEWYEL